jgi:hypothetical protein
MRVSKECLQWAAIAYHLNLTLLSPEEIVPFSYRHSTNLPVYNLDQIYETYQLIKSNRQNHSRLRGTPL